MGYKGFDPRAAHLEAAKVSGKGGDVLFTAIIWPNNPKQAVMGSSGAGSDSAPPVRASSPPTPPRLCFGAV